MLYRKNSGYIQICNYSSYGNFGEGIICFFCINDRREVIIDSILYLKYWRFIIFVEKALISFFSVVNKVCLRLKNYTKFK